MQNEDILAVYGNCPNCKYIGKVKHDERSEPTVLSSMDIIIGIVLLFFGVLPGVLWVLWCLAVRKKTTRFCRCSRCNYEFIIPLTENEYLEKIKNADTTKES